MILLEIGNIAAELISELLHSRLFGTLLKERVDIFETDFGALIPQLFESVVGNLRTHHNDRRLTADGME